LYEGSIPLLPLKLTWCIILVELSEQPWLSKLIELTVSRTGMNDG